MLLCPCFRANTVSQWTMLQFTFEAVDRCPMFPLGVKTTWRAYCADKVARIVEDEQSLCGFADEQLTVKTFPEADPEKGIPEGAYLLKRLPDPAIDTSTLRGLFRTAERSSMMLSGKSESSIVVPQRQLQSGRISRQIFVRSRTQSLSILLRTLYIFPFMMSCSRDLSSTRLLLQLMWRVVSLVIALVKQ